MDFYQGFPADCFHFGASLIFGMWPGMPAVSGEQCGSSQAASGAPGLWAAAPGTGKLQMKGIVHFFRRRLSAKLLRLTLFWCRHSFPGNTLVNNFEVKMKNYSLSAFLAFIHRTFMTVLVHLNGKAVLNANSLLLQAVSTVQLPVL